MGGVPSSNRTRVRLPNLYLYTQFISRLSILKVITGNRIDYLNVKR